MLILSSGRYDFEIMSGSLRQNEMRRSCRDHFSGILLSHQQHMQNNTTGSGNVKGGVGPAPNDGTHG